jgi:HEAT repeat protein
VHIVQRGAVKPLIDMLESSDVQLKEMAAFALGRLAQVIVSLIVLWSYALFKACIHVYLGVC